MLILIIWLNDILRSALRKRLEKVVFLYGLLPKSKFVYTLHIRTSISLKLQNWTSPTFQHKPSNSHYQAPSCRASYKRFERMVTAILWIILTRNPFSGKNRPWGHLFKLMGLFLEAICRSCRSWIHRCRITVEMYRRLIEGSAHAFSSNSFTISLAVQVHWSRSLSVHFPSV